MDGDIAPLKDIVDLAKKYQAITYVDDAHGDGVLGENGRGITNHFHLEGKVDVDMGTFSKAFGCVGGYVVGSKDLCTYLQNNGPKLSPLRVPNRRPFLAPASLPSNW